MTPWFALGWQIGTLTGWGQFGAHFARTLTQAGYRVILPPGSLTTMDGVLPLDRSLLQSLQGPLPGTGDGWLCMAIGNGMEERPTGLPDSIKVAGIIFCEDTGAIDAAKLNAYDVIVAGSRWTQRVLEEKGVERVILAHQGYDHRVFFPPVTVSQPALDGVSVQNPGGLSKRITDRVTVFSGGKLEFRKAQDTVVEAFKRFRQTPEGRDAVLVTAWDNQWPKTMDGIWLSGYVKGVPSVRNGKADVVSWLVANGVPAGAVIDCGRMTPPELAHVLRNCTVGIFPNRAESGTNLVLVEALASGLPCVASAGHGHDDVTSGYSASGLDVPTGCPLYRSTDGWVESAPGHLAAMLDLEPQRIGTFDRNYWSWSVRGPAMAEAILASAAVPV